MSEVFNCKGNDLNIFNKNIVASPGGFVQMLSNYPFPDMKCPLGCSQFVDHCKEIPLHYYLHHKCDFSLKNSNKYLFNSSRNDWPSTDSFLKWKVKPSQVMSKSNGLSTLVCKDHSQQDLCMKFFTCQRIYTTVLITNQNKKFLLPIL